MAARRRDRPARIVDAALATIAEKGWSAVSLETIAVATGLDLAEVYRIAPTRTAVLSLFARRIDIDVAASGDSEPPDNSGGDITVVTPRDRLFDVLMRRFDTLEPYRLVVAALARELPRDPLSVLTLMPQARRSFAVMLREARITDSGPLGHLRVSALLGVWMVTLRVWLGDDSEDKSPTMAALDRDLARVTEWTPLFRGDG